MCISVSSFPVISRVLSGSFVENLHPFSIFICFPTNISLPILPKATKFRLFTFLCEIHHFENCLFSSRVPPGGLSSTSPSLPTNFAVNSASFLSSLVGLSVVLLNLLILLENTSKYFLDLQMLND